MKYLFNSLKLSFSPMTIYEFDEFRNDEDICKFLERSTIYIIAKRKLPIMRLIDGKSNFFHISVHMNPEVTPLEITMLQEDNIALLHDGISYIRAGNNTTSQNDFHAVTLFGENNRFIMYANLDRLIHLHSNNTINLRISGDITPFITYEVLYVGQCTEEHIFDRFKTHHALLKILSKENIISPNYDKVNDLLILPFHIETDVLSQISSYEEFVNSINGNYGIDNKTVALDCEKALIKAMNPKYNSTKFKQYPKSKDGLFSHNLDFYQYKVLENLVLDYGDGNYIYGDVNGINSSIISVLENNDFFITSK